MMNEAHHGLLRCPRTRRVGRAILPAAHAFGVRHLAMEALWSRELVAEANETRRLPPAEGYLGQQELRELVQAALDLGWTLIAYEADLSSKPAGYANLSREETNRRELEQARNLVAALPDGPLLVWCGNSHLLRQPLEDWRPMGWQFAELAGFPAFALDQTGTVDWPGDRRPTPARLWADAFADELAAGERGFALEEAPPNWCGHDGVDAVLLSSDNAMN
jgi:hypothetical protein